MYIFKQQNFRDLITLCKQYLENKINQEYLTLSVIYFKQKGKIYADWNIKWLYLYIGLSQ